MSFGRARTCPIPKQLLLALWTSDFAPWVIAPLHDVAELLLVSIVARALVKSKPLRLEDPLWDDCGSIGSVGERAEVAFCCGTNDTRTTPTAIAIEPLFGATHLALLDDSAHYFAEVILRCDGHHSLVVSAILHVADICFWVFSRVLRDVGEVPLLKVLASSL